jgi:hypothetical protein
MVENNHWNSNNQHQRQHQHQVSRKPGQDQATMMAAAWPGEADDRRVRHAPCGWGDREISRA